MDHPHHSNFASLDLAITYLVTFIGSVGSLIISYSFGSRHQCEWVSVVNMASNARAIDILRSAHSSMLATCARSENESEPGLLTCLHTVDKFAPLHESYSDRRMITNSSIQA